ncbi:hypothetical protein F7725_007428 [Dissostichus mawsoni]|uniref:Uncharacterized protein n=1 Tax=Dissostichus mawsoni TaxID=36200 RepID=A0A7J5XWS5_DISMA|nr:hypothetical protein F7725_007428 [Dissostichus mawsoni]
MELSKATEDLDEQTEQKWTMENCKQLEDEQTIVDMKTKMEIIERQRQLTLEVMGKIEQLWEEAQRERNETDYLEKKQSSNRRTSSD